MRRLSTVLVSLVVVLPLIADAGDPRRGGPRRNAMPPQVDHPDRLRRIDDCGALREHVIDVWVDQLVWLIVAPFETPWSSPGGGEDAGSGLDYSTTNVQEAGVDELDFVKTDGEYLYVTMDSALHVMRSWPPESTARVSRVEIGDGAYGLFLHDDRALTASYAWSAEAWSLPFWGRVQTRLDVVDVSDRADPEIRRTLQIDGWLLDARKIGSDVYAVVQTWMYVPEEVWTILDGLELPEPPVDAPPGAWEQILHDFLRPLVEAVVDELPESSLLPGIVDMVPGEPEPTRTTLLSCSDVLLDPEAAGLEFSAVVHLDLAANDPPGGVIDATGIVAWGGTLYASGTTLYLAEPGWARSWLWQDQNYRTLVHAFDLAGPTGEPVRYAAAGSVLGYTYDQFAFSEHDGHLRVATHIWNPSDAVTQGTCVTVLARHGAKLDEVGRLEGIEPDERLYAVRFVAEVGYLVTFERIDPLITVDLSDPTDPSIIGELEVSGYSTYLHPMNDDQLLAMGVEVDPVDNRIAGLAVSIFDVSDLTAPQLMDRVVLEGEDRSWSDALWDHHAITFHRGVLAFPTYTWDSTGWDSALEVIEVDEHDGLRPIGSVSHVGLPGAGPWNRMRRSVIIEDWLYSISDAGIRVSPAHQPSVVVAEAAFAPSPGPIRPAPRR